MYDTQVDKDFNVKIADFGLARLKAHVMTGNLGTCQYMAPGNSHTPTLPLCTAAVHCVSCAQSLAGVVVNAEVLRNESYTESADVYSFGIIVWEIVARAPPFHGMQTMQIAYSVNQGMRPPIPSHCPLVRLPPPHRHPPFVPFVRLFMSPDVRWSCAAAARPHAAMLEPRPAPEAVLHRHPQPDQGHQAVKHYYGGDAWSRAAEELLCFILILFFTANNQRMPSIYLFPALFLPFGALFLMAGL